MANPADAPRDPRLDPRRGDTCRLEGVTFMVTDVPPDLVYVAEAGTRTWPRPWLREDWASAPASDWAVGA